MKSRPNYVAMVFFLAMVAIAISHRFANLAVFDLRRENATLKENAVPDSPPLPLGTITRDGFVMRDGTILRGQTSFMGTYKGLSVSLIPAISNDYDRGGRSVMSGWALFVDDDASTSTRTSSRLIHYHVFPSLGDFVENVDATIHKALKERIEEERRQTEMLTKFSEAKP